MCTACVECPEPLRRSARSARKAVRCGVAWRRARAGGCHPRGPDCGDPLRRAACAAGVLMALRAGSGFAWGFSIRLPAISTGQRNGLIEYLGRGLEVQSLPRSLVKLLGHGVELGLGVMAEVLALREVLA